MKAKIKVSALEASIDAKAKEAGELLDIITPDFVREGGGILVDMVRYWRWKNQVNIVAKA